MEIEGDNVAPPQQFHQAVGDEGVISKTRLIREGWLLLGGVLFAFLVWIPVVINVLPDFVGRDPEPWRWGFEHVPEFFGSQGADHAVTSWLVALIPYFILQLGRIVNRSVRIFRNKGDAREGIGGTPDREGSDKASTDTSLVSRHSSQE